MAAWARVMLVFSRASLILLKKTLTRSGVFVQHLAHGFCHCLHLAPFEERCYLTYLQFAIVNVAIEHAHLGTTNAYYIQELFCGGTIGFSLFQNLSELVGNETCWRQLL